MSDFRYSLSSRVFSKNLIRVKEVGEANRTRFLLEASTGGESGGDSTVSGVAVKSETFLSTGTLSGERSLD